MAKSSAARNVSSVASSAPSSGAQARRREESRERLLVAGAKVFCELGYFAASVEDIAAKAGVSRMTFYRHFDDKAAFAADLFRDTAQAAMPRFLAVGARNFRDRKIVVDWLGTLFAADRESRQLLRAFTQANAEETDFTARAQTFIADLIIGLGDAIPAFAVTPRGPGRRQWLEAWLLLFTILDQSNHASRKSGVATDPMVVDILADQFLGFVERDDARAPPSRTKR